MNELYSDLELNNESDVEQKLIYKLLTNQQPNGFGYFDYDFRTKVDIKKIQIDKGNNRKLYYPDYAIILNGLPCLIIEAKAPGEDLVEAMREARLYATEINSSYKSKLNPCCRIIATNGITLSASHWDEDKPIVTLAIDDINPINSDFDKLLKFVSRKAILKLSNKILQKIKSNVKYFKPVFMLGGKSVINETVGVNSFGANVSFEYKYLFNPDTLEDREAIVRNAYVMSKRKLSHVSPIDKIIKAAVPQYIIDAKLINDTSKPKEIIEQITNIKKVKNEICLLIGSVGSGKSTFTDYLRVKALSVDVSKVTEWIHINLNKAPLTRELIYNWTIENTINSIKNNHSDIDFDHIDILKDIYKHELTRILKGKGSLYKNNELKLNEIIYDELSKYQADNILTLKSIIKYLYSNKNKLLIIVLDNCDKRNREDQLLMFEVAAWLKDTFYCMIFLPLRDTTYDQFSDEPPLDTIIKDLVFRIDPPLLQKVVYNRLHYAISEIESNNDEFQYNLSNGTKVSCSRGEIKKYLQSIITSLFQDRLFRRIVIGLAGRNIRKGLEILLDFCISGHISDDELFKIRQSSGDYILPPYLIERILMKGKRKYYFDEESHIKNMFFTEIEDSMPDPFVRISILQWLKNNFRKHGPNKLKGFHKINTLISELQVAGHAKDRILLEIETLSKAGCITTESQTNEINEEDLFCIAPGGFIHLDLLRDINYLSCIAEDTYFKENQVAKRIADNLVGRGVYKLLSRQASINNSLVLTQYMENYYKNIFPGLAKILDDENYINLVEIKPLRDYVEKVAEHDSKYSNLQYLETEYPSGKQVCAHIVSIQDYGIFIEFDLKGRGLIHKSQFPGDFQNIFLDFEEGDWLIAEIIEYQSKHGRFLCKFIDK